MQMSNWGPRVPEATIGREGWGREGGRERTWESCVSLLPGRRGAVGRERQES